MLRTRLKYSQLFHKTIFVLFKEMDRVSIVFTQMLSPFGLFLDYFTMPTTASSKPAINSLKKDSSHTWKHAVEVNVEVFKTKSYLILSGTSTSK